MQGAYWAKEITRAENEGRICDVPVDTTAPVWTAWDLGVKDATAIWFYQPLAGGVNVVGYYEASGAGLDHYNDVLNERAEEGGYTYASDLVPHDAQVKEWGPGRTRIEQMLSLGRKPWKVPNHRLMDGINAGRMSIRQARFDRKRCAKGLEALASYHAEYDEERKVLKPTPLHDWSSNGADAWRYLSVGWYEARIQAPPPPSTTDFYIGTPEGTISSNLSIKEMIERKTRARKARDG